MVDNGASSELLDPSWIGWITENLLLGCSGDVLLATMQHAGLDGDVSARAIAAVRLSPIYRAAQAQRQQLDKLSSVCAVLAGLQARQLGDRPIKRCATLTQDQFLHDHYFGSRPVVLTDLAQDWPARLRWTPQYLAERYGQVELEVQAGRNSDPDYEINSPRLKRSMLLREFIAAVLSGTAGNDLYLTANNHALKRPDLSGLIDDIGTLPPWCDRSQLAQQALLWVGGAGVITPMHHDTVQLLHTQIFGRKRWRLVSPLQTPLVYNHVGVFSQIRMEQPDRQRFPLVDQLNVIDIVVGPGETLFVPVGWWHHVESLDVSISLSYTNFALPNRFDFVNPVRQ